MAWTKITRCKYQSDGLRYASDTTELEWGVIAPHMPPATNCGRTHTTALRDVMNAILYIAQTGANGGCCQETSSHLRRCSTVSTLGATRADGRPSTTRC
jgi:hypothetical protein